MKKSLAIIAALALVISMSAMFVSAAKVEGWTAQNEDYYEINHAGNLVIKGKENTGIALDKELSGDFTLEFQVNSAEPVDGTDQKFVLSLFATDQNNWLSGFWFRINGTAIQINDGTDGTNTFPESSAGACTVNIGSMNDIKVEFKNGKLTYYVNGSNIGEFTPASTNGKYLALGGNYYAVDASLIDKEFTVKGFKLTMGGETVTYFGDAEDLGTVIDTPASSDTVSSEPVASKPSVSIVEPSDGGCGNKAE